MTLPTRIAALVSLGTLFLAPAVFGQSTSQSNPSPSQADFDTCNKQAEAKIGAPSAAARPSTGPMITGPGTPATGNPGSPAPSSSSDGTAGKDMRITGSDVPGAREAGLSGMAAAGQGDAAYQQAYRDCMKSRGF